MKTNRELLELAAKAIGRTITGWNHQRAGAEVAVLDDGSYWQPLLVNGITDCDGDALRLAVTLKMSVEICEHEETTYAYAGKQPRVYGFWGWDPDSATATRRAIVLAAAELGRKMP